MHLVNGGLKCTRKIKIVTCAVCRIVFCSIGFVRHCHAPRQQILTYFPLACNRQLICWRKFYENGITDACSTADYNMLTITLTTLWSPQHWHDSPIPHRTGQQIAIVVHCQLQFADEDDWLFLAVPLRREGQLNRWRCHWLPAIVDEETWAIQRKDNDNDNRQEPCQCLFLHSVCTNFSLNTHSVCTNFGLIVHSPVYSVILLK